MKCNDNANCWSWFDWCPSTIVNVGIGVGIAIITFAVYSTVAWFIWGR